MTEIKKFLKRKEVFLSAIFLASIFFNFSCKKPEEEIGSQVQPQDGKLNFKRIDTVSLFAYSVYEDSLITGGILTNELKIGLLGTYLDPVFGLNQSEIYTELSLQEVKPNFGVDPNRLIVDSVIFLLKYDPDYYGSINSKQRLIVNELSEPFNDSTINYFSHDSLAASSENLVDPIANKNGDLIVFNPNSIGGTDTTKAPHIRMHLKKSLGEKVIKAPAAKLEDQKKFKELVKGIKISTLDAVPGGNQGGLFGFNLTDDSSTVIIYYRDLAVSDTVTKDFALQIGQSSSRKFERFKHDYKNSDVGNDILLGPNINRSKVYVQSLAGVMGILKLPHVEKFKDLNIAINKAELIFSVENTDSLKFKPCTRLGIYAFLNDSTNKDVLIADCDPEAGPPYSYFNGNFKKDINKYKINITTYFQELISGSIENHGVAIKTSLPRSEPNRTILFGPMDPNPLTRMRLEVTYTEYNP